MAREIVKVTIRKDGSMEVATEGIAGTSCIEKTQGLEAFLGKKVGDTVLTADYYKPDPKGPEPWIKRT